MKWTNPIMIVAVTVFFCTVINKQPLGRVDLLWSDTTFSSSNSLAWFDKWTLVHMFSGMMYEKIIAPAILDEYKATLLLALACGYECIENVPFLTKLWRQYLYQGDGLINSFIDICVCMLGYYIARRIPSRRVVFIGIIFTTLFMNLY